MIIGHKKQWEILTKGKTYHAFLFSGQESLGKKKVAIEFAKFLKCQSAEKPCHKCSYCLSIEKRTSSDFILIEPESEIKINQIREIKRKMVLSTDSYKVTIIDRAHLMSKDSQNCFLKILEEPEKNTVFILITEYPDLLLPTVLSRIQQIKFFPVTEKELEKYISEKEIIYFSLNKPGMAIKLNTFPEKIKEYNEMINCLEKLKKSSMAERFQEAKKLSEENLSEMFSIWLFYLRKKFLKECQNNEDYSSSKKNIKNLQNISSLVERTNINNKLALELLLIQLK